MHIYLVLCFCGFETGCVCVCGRAGARARARASVSYPPHRCVICTPYTNNKRQLRSHMRGITRANKIQSTKFYAVTLTVSFLSSC